jgi:Tol biopolymer transport system component
VAAVNSTDNDRHPSLSADRLTLYFSSERPGSWGPLDIWTATRASATSSFSAPVNLAEVNSSAVDYFPTISPDSRTLFFSSDRVSGTGEYDIWVATRASAGAAFSAPTEVTELNTTAGEAGIAISFDGLTIFVQSMRMGGLGLWDIWVATRPNAASPFSSLTNVTEVNSPSSDQGRWLSPDGRTLYLSSSRGSSWDIFRSTRSCL